MKEPYKLDDLDTGNYEAVSSHIVRIFEELFGDADSSSVPHITRDVAGMFAGDYPGYQAMDTVYHDLEHTLGRHSPRVGCVAE